MSGVEKVSPWNVEKGEGSVGSEEGAGRRPSLALCVILPIFCDPRSIDNILLDAATWSLLGCRTHMSQGEGQAQPL